MVKKIANIKKEHEEADAAIARSEELTIALQRLQAEFDNYRRREEQAKNALYDNASQKIIKKLIPVIDTFDLAIKSTSDTNAKQGMEMIYSQFISILNDEGVSKMEPLNEKFNPEEQEAIMVEKGEGPEIIIEVIQPGYKINNKIIRHAKVKIRRQQNSQNFESSSINGGNKNE